MADYFPIVAQAVAGLPRNTGDARRALNERAREALVAQLRGVAPALDESQVAGERLSLEEAIRNVEGEAARGAKASTDTALPLKKPTGCRRAASGCGARASTLDSRARHP
jgi:hypothetical protein